MFIYKATSKTTNKVYIGLSTQTLQQRINQHNSHAYNQQSKYHFHCAIRKYGPDDFEYVIIEDNIDNIETLKERERYWIKYYDSYYNGYNSTLGGEGKIIRDDEEIKRLFEEGKTTKEIVEITGHNKNTIYKSYQSSGLTEINNERKKLQNQLRCSRPVEQYDLEGNFIKEWSSATECGKVLGNQSFISAICNQKENMLSAYGFLFKYKDDERSIEEWVKRLKNKKTSGRPKKRILQLNENYDIINIYESGAEAARALGKDDKSNICSAARKGRKAYGYYWKYE